MTVDGARDSEVVSPIELTDRIALFGAPRMWVPLIGIVSAIIAVFLWYGFARAPITVPADGVITTEGGPLSVSTSSAGTVKSLFVVYGEQVQIGNTMALVEDDNGVVTRVRSPIEGTVIEVSTKVGDFAPVGVPLVTLQDRANTLRAVALIPMESIGGVAVGQPVLVSPTSVSPSEYGYIKGTVASIGTVPMSQARIDQLIGGLAGYSGSSGQETPVVEVVVSMESDPQTPSGFAWTIASGPPFPLLTSTPWSGQIILGERSRLSALFE